ncbi:AlbA family DNA-binding domain-containing protein [Nocardioides limicola]|uniref:AlbA family DNA-binding domain-containing protein n=1 Tax=Nocardioides limicola TaxID=2803368 RepID=UPI00193BDBB2|nr:ATP-binding protein [Nocardioides sp. DJM-14]
MRTVAFSKRDGEWLVHGEERRSGMGGDLVLAHDELADLRAVDLRDALSSKAEYSGHKDSAACVSPLSLANLDTDVVGIEVGFEYRDGHLLVTAMHFGDRSHDGDEHAAVAKVERLIAPYLAHKRATLASANVVDAYSGPEHLAIELRIALPIRGRTVQDLHDIGDGTRQLCDTLSSGSVSRGVVADLVRGGAAELLIGQPEGNWLDAKAQEYDLATLRGKVGLAQAVARFANGEDGGVIIIGAHAKKIPGGEEIRSVPGVSPRYKDTEARYRRILDHHLYPPVWGLRIDVVPTTDDKSLISIDIPPQPEELKPFLVHGAITADGDTQGSFISVVQRRGEGSMPITAPMIHASLAAGRALLRGAGRPQDSNE